ncbi:MAG: hypothetical protein R2747_19740 [Pyrinomonadaceae bacterium]
MKYKTEKEILEVVHAFETGTIERGAWGHPEHLLVAFCYSKENDFETALKKMRHGLFHLLRAFGVDLHHESPYHETLTVFWMRTVFDFAASRTEVSTVEAVDDLIRNFDKDYPLRFYSRELLFSDRARKRFVEGDRKIQKGI